MPFQKLTLALGSVFLAALCLLGSDASNRRNPPHLKSLQGTQEQGKTYHVAVAYLVPEPGVDAVMRGLKQGLLELGLSEGRDIVFRHYHAQGEISEIAPMEQAIAAGDADAILTLTTPVLQGVGLSSRQKPVVFTYVVDPIAAGAGPTFEQHRPNLTGVGSLPPVNEMVRSIQEILPNVRRLGTLYNPSEANAVRVASLLREEAAKAGMSLIEVPLHTSADALSATQALLAQKPEVLVSVYDNTFYEVFDTVSLMAERAGIPLIIDQTDFLDKGALMAIGVNFEDSGHAAADPLVRVLKGTPPASIPLVNVSQQTVEINPKMAEKYGIQFPENLKRAANPKFPAITTKARAHP